MKEIRGDAKTVRQLLSGAKYAIDYYQREYKWQTKQLQELLDDLSEQFLDDYESGDERSKVSDYSHYFLGAIIISDKNGRKYIIDGQQRLTTLTLLLIFLNNTQKKQPNQVNIAELIFSEKFSKRSFNIDVDERIPAMNALFNGAELDENGQSESVHNILGRYADIVELFPEELKIEALPYFIDWLTENVHLVEITAYSDDDAYTIFETMNDRGLSLSPTDMLKGYLLANITDEEQRASASKIWREKISVLNEVGKDEDADCLKAWLRSQYANSIRERKRGSVDKDFEKIGNAMHRWVRDSEKVLKLEKSADFTNFIEEDFAFYSRQYEILRKASETFTPGLETVFYNARHNFTLQYPLLLAPLVRGESEEVIQQKIQIVGSFIDILITRRIWNSRSIDQPTMQYAMFLVMKEIRGKSISEITKLLSARLSEETETFDSNDRFHLHGGNGRQIHHLLARMTEFLETQSDMPSHYTEYIIRSGKKGYEVEHIWANHWEQHKDEFTNAGDFDEYRNRFGDLLLLPKSFNASYGDLPYEAKLEHYDSQNLLARSLHQLAYSHNPGFLRFIDQNKLPLKPHAVFKKANLDERQSLYQTLAKIIWNPNRLSAE